MNKIQRNFSEHGLWCGVMMGIGAVSYLGYVPSLPVSYPKNAMSRDLNMIGGDMYAGLRSFHEEAKKQTPAT